jgi:hypothetical protein
VSRAFWNLPLNLDETLASIIIVEVTDRSSARVSDLVANDSIGITPMARL